MVRDVALIADLLQLDSGVLSPFLWLTSHDGHGLDRRSRVFADPAAHYRGPASVAVPAA